MMIPDYKTYNLERRGWQQVKKNDFYTSYRRGCVLVMLWRHQTLIVMRAPKGKTAAERNSERNTIILPAMDRDEALDYVECLPYNFENS